MAAIRRSLRISWVLQKLLLGALSRTICLLPEREALFLGSRIGDLLRILLPKKRRIIRDNLARSDLVLAERESPQTFERKVFRHFGIFGAEFFRMKILSDEMVREKFSPGGWEGLEHLREVLGQGHGAIVFSGHIGNWELVIRRMAIDFPGRTCTVIRPIKNPAVHEFVEHHRLACGGGRSILSSMGARPLVRALSSGKILNVVIDQSAGAEEGEFVPFFGRLACTYSSLARLSLCLNIPVIPALSYRLPDGTHHRAFFASPIRPILDLPKEEAVYSLTALYTKFIEEAIRTHPEQWIWMHRRWKTRSPSVSTPL
ncbi:MAG: lysophospholipid acyltransferase family protein [Nitrospirae bacterium]|nr:lysophospholipid acyltransferase family protein [Nitrospirota bacterium]